MNYNPEKDSFNIPMAGTTEIVRRWMLKMPISDWEGCDRWNEEIRQICQRHLAECGDLSAIVSRVSTILRADYEKLAREWHGRFDYLVGLCDLAPGAIEVVTCLRPKQGEGSIQYGRLILRLGEDEYALWSFDD